MLLLCRNKVQDYAAWRACFDGDAQAHRDAGLRLSAIWRDHDDANTVFFAFNVDSVKSAQAFIGAPDARVQAEKSGVVEGDYHFLEALPPYAPGNIA